MSIEIKAASAALIGLEARANPFTMINPQIKENLLNLTANLGESLTSVSKSLFQSENIRGVSIDLYATKKAIGRHEYMDVRSVKMPVPEGFKGRYAEYTDLLFTTFGGMGDLVKDVLVPVNDALSLLVANPERATGVTGDSLLRAITYPESTIEEFKGQIPVFFEVNGTDEYQPFGDVFERNKDLVTFIEQVIKLSKVYDKRQTTDILKHINYLNEVSDLLYVRLKSGQLTEIQNKQADMAAQMLSKAAHCVEVYAALCTLIEQLLAYAGQVYRQVTTVLNQ